MTTIWIGGNPLASNDNQKPPSFFWRLEKGGFDLRKSFEVVKKSG
tara:strand:+ start:471 stop:605 length:135 start_codon:yes stop_codon:yes gene_type:complete